jgi:hypothetical protein
MRLAIRSNSKNTILSALRACSPLGQESIVLFTHGECALGDAPLVWAAAGPAPDSA